MILHVPAAFHNIDPARRFETRTIMVTWSSGGQFCQKLIRYKVVPFLAFTVTPVDVRAFLGISEDELEDAEIDLTGAYLRLEAVIGRDRLAAAMTAGTSATIQANDALLHTAVIALMPGLRLRAVQSKENGVHKLSRFASAPDFAGLLTDAENRLALATIDLQGRSTGAAPMLVLSHPRNPFPGRWLCPPTGSQGY